GRRDRPQPGGPVAASRQQRLPVRAEGDRRNVLLYPVLQDRAEQLRGCRVADADKRPPGGGRTAAQGQVLAVAAEGERLPELRFQDLVQDLGQFPALGPWLAELQGAKDVAGARVAPGRLALVQREQPPSFVEEKGRD